MQPTTAAASAASGGATILIADKFEPQGVAALEKLGCAVHCESDVTPETLPQVVSRIDPSILIVRSTKVKAPVFEKAASLSLVVRAGAGYDNIDVAAASSRGVFVANCPGKNAIAVAELTWGLILSCDRRIPDQTADLRLGKWDKKGYAKCLGLYGRTLGIVGLGTIGQEVAKRGKAFGMRVVAWSRSLTEDRAAELGVEYCSSLINLAKMSDVVSLHVAATAETERLINESFLHAMKKGAILINTSRGSVVDEAALAAAIREKGLKSGLDVFAHQPAPTDTAFSDPIVKEPGVYGTHHNGASTDQAQAAIAAETVRIVRTYLDSGNVLHCVNRAQTSPATTLLTVRHLNRPGVLTHVFDIIGNAKINVEEMENVIYDGAHAACARIHLDGPLNDRQVGLVQENPNVLSVSQSPVRK